jgi:transcriptional regulator with GAF, ATPase, and Fis domain
MVMLLSTVELFLPIVLAITLLYLLSMNMDNAFHFNNDAVQSLLLEMGQQRTTKSLFDLVVSKLSQFKHISLVRIWLKAKGDVCSECLVADECYDKNSCLHLVASAGKSIYNDSEDWSRINGAHKRFPLGARKVGHIAATGEPVVVPSIEEDSKWIAHPEWAKKEGIKGFAGQPMLFQGEVLGVLAVFTLSELTPQVLDVLRIIANHAASTLANAEAFEKISQLKKQLEGENEFLRKELSNTSSYGRFIGKSAALQHVFKQIELVAATDANVLILGESGTGKELVAREVHARSQRKNKPLIKVNCASISRELFASEFFGHTRGAFTGAVSHREGLFAAAHTGTLFLDEIGEIPIEYQAQLLRVLQEREYQRVGEEQTRTVDTRIIAATNKNLHLEIEKGNFREDLYFRLNVFPIVVPPLRERPEDIEPLANYFLARCLENMNRPSRQFSSEHIQQLMEYRWPGNVRELQNIVERFAISSNAESNHLELPNASGALQEKNASSDVSHNHERLFTEQEVKQLQIENTKRALERCNWKIYGPNGAAELLGIKATTLATRIKKYNLAK